MEIDFSLLLAIWLIGWGCGALSWYFVLKFYDGNNRASKKDKERE